MVPRQELLAALSDAQTYLEDSRAAAGDVTRLHEQLNAARLEAAAVRADASGMVSRASLEAVRAALESHEAAARSEGQRLREALAAAGGRAEALEVEKAQLIGAMQVQGMEERKPS
jgi:hypothetical protein